MTAGRVPGDRLWWPLDAIVEIARDWIARFIAVQGVDRAMAIGAQAYTALIPLLIVYSSVLPVGSNRSFAEALITRFGLTGSAADELRTAFAPSGTVQAGVTALGVVLLLVSALSFTRGLQRLYEGAFGLPTLGMRNTTWGLVWIVAVCIASIVRPLLVGGLDGRTETIVSLVFGTGLWLLTPYLLLGRRVHWKRLAPASALSTIGLAGVGIWSALWMPHTLSASAAQFGVIGIGFALLAWLVAVAGVLVVAATGGAMVADRLDRRHAGT